MKVYDVETGAPLECHSVDANELIASGQYSMAAPQAEPEKPEAKGKK